MWNSMDKIKYWLLIYEFCTESSENPPPTPPVILELHDQICILMNMWAHTEPRFVIFLISAI